MPATEIRYSQGAQRPAEMSAFHVPPVPLIAKTLTPDSVSARIRAVRREASGRLDSKLFPASAWANCFYEPKPTKTPAATSEQMVTHVHSALLARVRAARLHQ